jgi:hypothetical protein
VARYEIEVLPWAIDDAREAYLYLIERDERLADEFQRRVSELGLGAGVDLLLKAGVAAGTDIAALGDAFKECFGDAFSALFHALCARIADACADASAPDACDDLVAACNDPASSP